MVELTFDRNDHKASADNPSDYALRLWLQLADEEIPLAVACTLAPYDFDVWTQLRAWVNPTTVASLPPALLAAVCVAVASDKPRAGKGDTARRDVRLRAVAAALGRAYPKLPAFTVAVILTTLPGCSMVAKAMETLIRKRP